MKHTVDDYTILGEIGRGTYSIVYKAEHSKTGKIVALK
jgi:serine/threonine protein kinase